MQKKQLEMDISRQEKTDKIIILKVFKDENWLIFYVDPYISDKISFYHKHILKTLSSQNGAVELTQQKKMIYNTGLK